MKTIFYLTILTILFSCHRDINKKYRDSDFYEIDGKKLKIYNYSPTLDKQKIKALSFEGQSITELPTDLVDFKEIEYLNLRTNKLNELPTSITEFKNLKVLFLDSNPIEKLPNSFAKLTTLRILTITSTNISKLPDNFENMSLKVLLIGSAPIDEVLRDKLRRTMINCKIIEAMD